MPLLKELDTYGYNIPEHLLKDTLSRGSGSVDVGSKANHSPVYHDQTASGSSCQQHLQWIVERFLRSGGLRLMLKDL